MGYVLTFAIQKGGSGKTASVISLAPIFAQWGARVLVVDTDPQANLTDGLGVDDDSFEYTTYEVLLNPEQGTEFATVKTQYGVDLVPSNIDLAGAEYELSAKIGRELLLAKAIKQARQTYDYILIDPPPTLGFFTLNALAAADAVIIPMQTHPDAYKAVPKLEATIDAVRELNSQLHIGGVFCTMTDRTSVSQTLEDQVRKRYEQVMFRTNIPRNTAMPEAKLARQPVSVYAPRSAAAVAYHDLAREIEGRYGR